MPKVWKVSDRVLNLVFGQIAPGSEKNVLDYLNKHKRCNQAKILKCYGRFDFAIVLEDNDFSFIDNELSELFLDKNSQAFALLDNVFIRAFRWDSDGVKFDFNKIRRSKFIGFYFITLDKDRIKDNPFEKEQRIIDKFYEKMIKMNQSVGALYESLGLIDLIIILGSDNYDEFFELLSYIEEIAAMENAIIDINTLFGVDLKIEKKIDTRTIEITLSTHYKPTLKREIEENIQYHFGDFDKKTYLSSSGDLIIDLKAPLVKFTEKLLDFRESSGEGVLSTRTQFYKEERHNGTFHERKVSLVQDKRLSSGFNKVYKDLKNDKNFEHLVPILMEILGYVIAYENLQNDPLRKNVFLELESSFISINLLLRAYSERLKDEKDKANLEELKRILGQYSHNLKNIFIQRLSEYQMITFSGMRIIGIEKFSGSLKILQAAESIPNYILGKCGINRSVICGLGFQAEYSFTIGNFMIIPSQMYLEASSFWTLGHETGHSVWIDPHVHHKLSRMYYENLPDDKIILLDAIEQTFADIFDYVWMFGGKDYKRYLSTIWEFMLKYGYDIDTRIVRSAVLLKLMVPEFRDKGYKEIVKELIKIIRTCGKNSNIEINTNIDEITCNVECIADKIYEIMQGTQHIIGNGISVEKVDIDRINSELKNGKINIENNPVEIVNALVWTKNKNKTELRKELTAIMSLYYYRLNNSCYRQKLYQ